MYVCMSIYDCMVATTTEKHTFFALCHKLLLLYKIIKVFQLMKQGRKEVIKGRKKESENDNNKSRFMEPLASSFDTKHENNNNN